jgi:hypothetical protein
MQQNPGFMKSSQTLTQRNMFNNDFDSLGEELKDFSMSGNDIAQFNPLSRGATGRDMNPLTGRDQQNRMSNKN